MSKEKRTLLGLLACLVVIGMAPIMAAIESTETLDDLRWVAVGIFGGAWVAGFGIVFALVWAEKEK